MEIRYGTSQFALLALYMARRFCGGPADRKDFPDDEELQDWARRFGPPSIIAGEGITEQDLARTADDLALGCGLLCHPLPPMFREGCCGAFLERVTESQLRYLMAVEEESPFSLPTEVYASLARALRWWEQSEMWRQPNQDLEDMRSQCTKRVAERLGACAKEAAGEERLSALYGLAQDAAGQREEEWTGALHALTEAKSGSRLILSGPGGEVLPLWAQLRSVAVLLKCYQRYGFSNLVDEAFSLYNGLHGRFWREDLWLFLPGDACAGEGPWVQTVRLASCSLECLAELERFSDSPQHDMLYAMRGEMGRRLYGGWFRHHEPLLREGWETLASGGGKGGQAQLARTLGLCAFPDALLWNPGGPVYPGYRYEALPAGAEAELALLSFLPEYDFMA